MSDSIGADSEIGCLRTVLVHRPGAELRRVTPMTASRLRFDRVPWLARAQQEHDALTEVLRSRGADVLFVTELLQDVLEYSSARDEVIGSVLADAGLGHELGSAVRCHLESLRPEDLSATLIGGLLPCELRTGRGLVYELLSPHDFVIDPLPNLAFTRDSSVWIGDQLVITGLRGSRAAENTLVSAIYRHHPRFAGLGARYHARPGHLDGGDVVFLAPGVVAVGVGRRTTPASVERLAQHLLDAGVVHTVLAVPVNQPHPAGCLDLACTVIGPGTVLMAPALAFTLTAITITARDGMLAISRRRPFLEAAARAIGVDRLTVIDTGVDPCSAVMGGLAGIGWPAGVTNQWDDGANVLAVGQRSIVCDERNLETNARLRARGYDVVTVAARELGGLGDRSGRGPRSMCAVIERTVAPSLDSDVSALAAPADAAMVSRNGAQDGFVDPAKRPRVAPVDLVSGSPSREHQDAAPVGLAS